MPLSGRYVCVVGSVVRNQTSQVLMLPSMRSRFVVLIAIAVTAVYSPTQGQASGAGISNIVEAHIDERGNVVVTREDGRVLVLTSDGGYDEASVSKNNRTVAWIRTTQWESTLFIYRDGAIKKIKGDPFIRGFWFVDGGSRIGIDSGGMHFAGIEYLYDVATLKKLDSVNQSKTPTAERPSWSNSSDKFKDE
jgi:hypothetical protein